jgi:hypothetical protein
MMAVALAMLAIGVTFVAANIPAQAQTPTLFCSASR